MNRIAGRAGIELLILLLFLSVLPTAQAQGRRQKQSSRQSGPQAEIQPTASFKGILKGVDGSKILLELADGNIMEFHATRKTRIQVGGKDAKLKDLASGQKAEIDGRHVLGAVEALLIRAAPTAVKQP